MPQIFANPNLPNYFVTASDVTSAATARDFVAEYEDAKVIIFPNLKADIDLDFWSTLNLDAFPSLKKFSFNVGSGDVCDVTQQSQRLVSQGLNAELASVLANQLHATLAALSPIYRRIFSSYNFDEDKKKVVWRLNTIMNENMHVDTYKEETQGHFARMFVNLDSQPRIWQTSWPIDNMIQRLLGKMPPSQLEGMSRGDIWAEINRRTFGKSSREWWDGEPRHVAYFLPGDVWIVDSRQISHQIFYGRRALSIDFSIPRSGMKDQSRHYLEFAQRFRDKTLDEVTA